MRPAHKLAALPAALMLALVGPAALPVPEALGNPQAGDSSVVLRSKDHALNPDGAPFPDLEVRVSKTRNLTSEGITISYRGGPRGKDGQSPTVRPNGSEHGGQNFLQIFQCWGEDPVHKGRPDRRTCQYGGTGRSGSDRFSSVFRDHPVHPNDEQYTAQGAYSKMTGIPFVAWNPQGSVDENQLLADKTLAENVLAPVVPGPDGQPVLNTPVPNFAENPFFDLNSTNEETWAPFGPGGNGSVPFEVQTQMQAPGLGCGRPLNDGKGSSCWLVILPRGESDSGAPAISKPGLWWDAWEHHMAVRLDFAPLGNRCNIGAAERQLMGTELAAGAIGSWQPVLCTAKGGSPYVASQVPPQQALRSAASDSDSPMALASRPLSQGGDTPDPLTYAPLLLGGVTVSYKIDSRPDADASAEVRGRRGLALQNMKLTPRLMAKLLTYSYNTSLPTRAAKDHLGKNPWSLLDDPEFRKINGGDWAQQNPGGSREVATVLVPLGSSEMAQAVWDYVMADKEARDWLAGSPDPWGMKVNPWFSTNDKVNPTKEGLPLPMDSFPKSDPSKQPNTLTDGSDDSIDLVMWRPFTANFSDGAYHVLRGEGLGTGSWNPGAPPKYGKAERMAQGEQQLMAMSSSPAAERYQTASALLRNPAGEFVGPTVQGLTAAAQAMSPNATQPQVMELDPKKMATAKGAYPLTMPVYAALNPAQPDAANRDAFAKLIEYGAGQGQTPGQMDGQLPPGYAPIPKEWRSQALAAAKQIRSGAKPETEQPSPQPSQSPLPNPGSDAPPTGDDSDPVDNSEFDGDQPDEPFNPDGGGGDEPAFNPSGEGDGPAPAPGDAPDNNDSGDVPAVDAPPNADNPPAAETDESTVPEEPGEQAAGGVSYGTTPADPPTGPLGVLIPVAGVLGLAAAVLIPILNRRRQSVES